jgi:hypothetical protein
MARPFAITRTSESLRLDSKGRIGCQATPTDLACAPDMRAELAQEHARTDARRRPAGGPPGSNAYRPGCVWREAHPHDVVRVPPSSHSRAAGDNSLANARRLRQPQ